MCVLCVCCVCGWACVYLNCEVKKLYFLLAFGFAFYFNVRAQHYKVLQAQDFAWYVEYFNLVDDEPHEVREIYVCHRQQ